MFCSKCGAKNDDSAKFCEKCGEPLERTSYKTDLGSSSALSIKSMKLNRKVGILSVIIIVAIVVIISIALWFSSNKFLDDLRWGMSMQQVASYEENSGSEYKGTYIVNGKECWDLYCDMLYSFDTKDRLIGVSYIPMSSNYSDYFDMFFLLTEKYGDPYYIEEDLRSDSESPHQVVWWTTKNSSIFLSYTGEDYSRILLHFDKGNTGPEKEEANVNFVSELRQCTSASAVGGCDNQSLPWSPEHCREHNCNVIGCDEYPWSDKNDIPLCIAHYLAMMSGVIVNY